MNAAQDITRTLRRREQYRSVLFFAKQLFAAVQFLFAAALIYALLVLALAI